MRKSIIFVTLVSIPFFYGFATVVSGTKQDITINTSPAGAEVVVDGFVKGITPLSFDLKRKKNQTITIRKEGYTSQTLSMAYKFNNTFWGNALVGGLIGSSIDSSTGATVEYEPSNFHVTLVPKSMTKLERQDFNKITEARSFILSNYYNLTSDIAEGEGQYLSNLFGAFGREYQDSDDTITTLKLMVEQYDNIPDFAEAVVETFVS